MTSQDALEKVQVLSAQDGDTIVVRAKAHLTLEQTRHIVDMIRSQIAADVRVLVLGPDTDISVLRIGSRAERIDELLETNNAYQERYRKAETKLRDLGVAP